MKIRFLIVDDDKNIRRLCTTIGTSLGFECSEADSGQAALNIIDTASPDMILADLMMPNMSGLEFLDEVKKLSPRTEVAIMTGHGSIEAAVRAMRMGAYDFITKPFRIEELKLLLQRMEEKIQLVAENQFLRERVSADSDLNGIIGSSAKIQDVLRMVARLKDTRTPVLITGESGTGKELVARAIHYRGILAKKPFIAVDCGSLVPTLIESELFGYEKGAFTGANRSKEGLFQAANAGTIFLDEIGELPLEMQAKLLRVLQEKEVRPVGRNDNVRVDVRVIAATNRDLEASYRNGSFRKDLFFRLNVVTIHLPSLRERRTDIPTLVNWFLDKYAQGKVLHVSDAAMNCMLEYEWPGNVRELENCIERAVALGSDSVLNVHDLPPALRAHAPGARTLPPKIETGNSATATDLEELEKETIQRVFAQVHGDKALALKMLGISRATLYRKLKRYNISPEKGISAAAS
ncbi:MAG TPA: sigma-54 dependent transcriptional regulator [Terriglobales bacterium]|nr:sigma-54 dependent transcriptional regulator [Terriglobales bacterium]